jgi:hypothetical protein
VRFEEVPLLMHVPALGVHARGTRLMMEVMSIDELTIEASVRPLRVLDAGRDERRAAEEDGRRRRADRSRRRLASSEAEALAESDAAEARATQPMRRKTRASSKRTAGRTARDGAAHERDQTQSQSQTPTHRDRYAVVGNPVAHSKSPAIHAQFAQETGEAVDYDRLLAPLDGFVEHVRRLRSGRRGST